MLLFTEVFDNLKTILTSPGDQEQLFGSIIELISSIVYVSGSELSVKTEAVRLLLVLINANNEIVESVCDNFYEFCFAQIHNEGNPPQLIYTPLTAKCYLTLCESIAFGYGGNSYGLAGTGKTESVKALGQALGRQVLVFNCDEAIVVDSMCRIFTGLVMGGAWGCFDEFNRLGEEVLSVLSQQIQVIQASLLNKSPSVLLNGRENKVSPNAGFQDSKSLSKKIVLAFKLCKQLLSPERHYDWELRARKSILSTADASKDANKEANEEQLLLRAFRLSTLSKLTVSDRIIFEQIVEDTFDVQKTEETEKDDLKEASIQILQEQNLSANQTQIEKLLQMREALNQRTGVVLVGPSGSGKTTLWRVLLQALKKIGILVDTEIMNPKSMPRKQLIGYVVPDTREWIDGVLTKAARRAVASPNRTLIVCNSDIDPEWIESLNSVLDDNRLLTLPNGERIQFDWKINFVFESDSLQHASPATVSRMVVILLSSEEISIEEKLNKYVADQSNEYKLLLKKTISSLINNESKFAIETTPSGAIENYLSILSFENDVDFVLSLAKGAGSILQPKYQQSFYSEIYQNAVQLSLALTGIDPSKMIDQYYDRGTKLFEYHSTKPVIPPLSETSLSFMQTIETQRTLYPLKKLLNSVKPILFVGSRSIGKSTNLKHLFKSLKSTVVVEINCSVQTNADTLLNALMGCCTINSFICKRSNT